MIRTKLNLFQSNSFPVFILSAVFCLLGAGASIMPVHNICAQQQSEWSPKEVAIMKQIQGLRQLPDVSRGAVTRQLALEIRQLPPSDNKVRLAAVLATLSTEGDPGGRGTVQEVATTLAGALGQHPISTNNGQPATPYRILAATVHFEHMNVDLDSPEFATALAQLRQDDLRRQQADFTLADLKGHDWTLKNLHGKVVLVNFWATWCPPCRKEIPDLGALYKRFKADGLVVLGISDETATKVQPFVRQEKISYPVLLDPGGRVSKLYSVAGIPMSFVYNRDGKLVAESMDMRTSQQFLAMLAEAGLK